MHLPTYLTKNPVTGKSEWTQEPRETTVAHELIHSIYSMNGQNIPREGPKAIADTYEYKSENDTKVRETWWKEETDTVGLTGNRKYTENKIRKEQGFRIRIKY